MTLECIPVISAVISHNTGELLTLHIASKGASILASLEIGRHHGASWNNVNFCQPMTSAKTRVWTHLDLARIHKHPTKNNVKMIPWTHHQSMLLWAQECTLMSLHRGREIEYTELKWARARANNRLLNSSLAVCYFHEWHHSLCINPYVCTYS